MTTRAPRNRKQAPTPATCKKLHVPQHLPEVLAMIRMSPSERRTRAQARRDLDRRERDALAAAGYGADVAPFAPLPDDLPLCIEGDDT